MDKAIHEGDFPEAFDTLPVELQQELLEWVKCGFIPMKNINYNHNSYSLKGMFEHPRKTYITNGQLKGAMLKAGFRSNSDVALNWYFNISEKSPALKEWHKFIKGGHK